MLRLFFFYSDRQHIAYGAVQYPVSSRTKDQCQAVAPVAADNGEVDIILFGEVVHLLRWLADQDMGMLSR